MLVFCIIKCYSLQLQPPPKLFNYIKLLLHNFQKLHFSPIAKLDIYVLTLLILKLFSLFICREEMVLKSCNSQISVSNMLASV